MLQQQTIAENFKYKCFLQLLPKKCCYCWQSVFGCQLLQGLLMFPFAGDVEIMEILFLMIPTLTVMGCNAAKNKNIIIYINLV